MPPTPSFDTWTVVFLIAAVQGAFMALVLFRWRRGHPSGNRLLATLLLLFSITLVEYVLYWTRYIGQFPHMAEVSTQFTFLFGPLIWWYLRTIYEDRPLRVQDAWHLVPFVLAVAAMLPWYMLDLADKQAVISGKAYFPIRNFWFDQMPWVRIVHMLLYVIWNYSYIIRQPRVAATTRWALALNGFFLGFVLAYASYFILVQFPLFNRSWDYHISAAMTAFIYFIAYSGYVQPAVFEGFAWTEPAAPVKYRHSGLTPEASRSLLQKLQQVMQEEQLFRDAEIGLEGLSARLQASKHHVSQVINEHLGHSFFEYINQLRVEEAKRLLAQTSRSDLHVMEAAYAVGFNNKMSFNTAFKKSTGMTPTEYRKSHGRSDTGGVAREAM